MGRALGRALRARGLDVLTASEAGLRAAPDDIQLAFATATGRAIVTSNAADFAKISRDLLVAGKHHTVVLVLPQRTLSIGDAAARLARMAQLDAAELADRVVYIPPWEPLND